MRVVLGVVRALHAAEWEWLRGAAGAMAGAVGAPTGEIVALAVVPPLVRVTTRIAAPALLHASFACSQISAALRSAAVVAAEAAAAVAAEAAAAVAADAAAAVAAQATVAVAAEAMAAVAAEAAEAAAAMVAEGTAAAPAAATAAAEASLPDGSAFNPVPELMPPVSRALTQAGGNGLVMGPKLTAAAGPADVAVEGVSAADVAAGEAGGAGALRVTCSGAVGGLSTACTANTEVRTSAGRKGGKGRQEARKEGGESGADSVIP